MIAGCDGAETVACWSDICVAPSPIPAPSASRTTAAASRLRRRLISAWRRRSRNRSLWSRRGWMYLGTAGPTLRPPGLLRQPARADGVRRGRQRAQRQPRRRRPHVELAWRDVVRRVGMEERGQVLDLSPPRSELELAASIQADAPLGAGVVEVEE